MTERGRHSVTRDATSFGVGPSRLDWEGDALRITIDEIAVPHLRPVRGTIRLHPEALTDYEAVLDSAGHHCWRPFAPLSRVEVALEAPGLNWSGHGYFDANMGTRPLDEDFRHWNWSRSRLGDSARIFYEAERRDGTDLALDLRAGVDGTVEVSDETPPKAALPGTLWRVARETRSEADARILRRMEDAPFYSRAMLETRLDGQVAETVHESLDLDRFASRWVKALLPWRMPRATWWGG
ncbi:MAG: carotenoid 1,2-hydratase [Pseudomonadota bacterium]